MGWALRRLAALTWVVSPIALGLAACSPATGTTDQRVGNAGPLDPGVVAGYAALRKNMIGFASVDGALVIAVQPKGACAATIQTRNGPVRFDWRSSGDVNAYGEAGQEGFPLQDSSGRRRLVSVPSGDAANGIMMTVGVLFGH